MKVSELSAALAKVQTIAGDAEIVLRDALSDAETVITDLGVKLDLTGGAKDGTLVVGHSAAEPVEPEAPAAPAEPAA